MADDSGVHPGVVQQQTNSTHVDGNERSDIDIKPKANSQKTRPGWFKFSRDAKVVNVVTMGIVEVKGGYDGDYDGKKVVMMAVVAQDGDICEGSIDVDLLDEADV
ncbi:hypothetical protein C0Q70_19130 [Pomacea canaliculata]|uniref:Uncharacterized protein n=1 Tax=Pomacea canaliculata TaxID=400727 RepID=A0A2T7NIJ3_POMCA|nr:hypothetical protein C0Q70_19130 [Pomacea canaliculata]